METLLECHWLVNDTIQMAAFKLSLRTVTSSVEDTSELIEGNDFYLIDFSQLFPHWMKMTVISLIKNNSDLIEWTQLLWNERDSNEMRTTIISWNDDKCYLIDWRQQLWNEDNYYELKTTVISSNEDNFYGIKTIVMKWWKLLGNEENCYGMKITVI